MEWKKKKTANECLGVVFLFLWRSLIESGIYFERWGWMRTREMLMGWECRWWIQLQAMVSCALGFRRYNNNRRLLKDVINPITLMALWWLLFLIYYLCCSKHTLLKAKPECLPTLKTFQSKLFGCFPSWAVSLLTMATHGGMFDISNRQRGMP